MSDEPTMIERVARAIAKKDAAYRHWRDLDAASRIIYLGLARAAIEEMREPTDAMIDAGNLPGWDDCVTIGLSEEIWPVMIDAALNKDAS